jgi:hypothetical protein
VDGMHSSADDTKQKLLPKESIMGLQEELDAFRAEFIRKARPWAHGTIRCEG